MTTYFSVTELTAAIKGQLESRFFKIRVKGEISNLKEQTSGHLYFSLKDSTSLIQAVLFKGNASQLKEIPKSGDEVIVEGELNVYAPRGTYQIVVRTLEKAGLGPLLLKFHELKKKLGDLGWFDAAHKKKLPPFPKKIGVITSPTGAVLQDIIQVLSRRAPGFHLILGPVKVQGEGAALEIAEAIREFNRLHLVDVLIVGRGGGSLEDLWAFNEEIVAKAIFESEIPIISAVGHETDISIADFVADVRAPTPSAAAEIAIKERTTQLTFLDQLQKRLLHLIQGQLKQERTRLERFQMHPYFTSPYGTLGIYLQKTDELANALHRAVLHRLETAQTQFIGMKRLYRSIPLELLLKRKREQYKSLIAHLEAIDPKNVLKKGYCIPFSENSTSVIMSSADLEMNQNLSLLFHDGRANVTVKELICKKTTPLKTPISD
ncbi:MAG: exodeoxyribonuclease VII large subunit [Simkaniaceae bacterium]|nr:exodeoxyribonuclease VII large subunit [Simkaniaceae bacterium]